MEPANIIKEKIRDFHRRSFLYQVTTGLINFCLFVLVIWLSSIMADSVFYFSTAVRWFVLILNILVTLFLAYYLFLSAVISYLRIVRSGNLLSVTKLIGRLYPALGDRLTNMYQLISELPRGSSPALREMAVSRFSEKFAGTPLAEKLKWSAYLLPLKLLIPVFAGSLLLTGLIPDTLGHSLKRILNPGGTYLSVPVYKIAVVPGDADVIAGKSLHIRVMYEGPEIEKCILVYKHSGEGTSQTVPLEGSLGKYDKEIKDIKKSFTYYIKAIPVLSAEWKDKLVSQQYSVRTLIPPLVNRLNIKIKPPAYTGLEEKYLEPNVGDIMAYPGSVIDLNVEASKSLGSAQLIFSDSTKKTGSLRENRFNTTFKIHKNLAYSIRITDDEQLTNQDPIIYTITVLDDIFPAVEVVEPGEDVELAADGALTLVMEGRDDFGFSALDLQYQILGKMPETTDSTWQNISLPIPAGEQKSFRQTFLWNFARLSVGFEESVRYYVSVADNDPISGPKTGRSAEYYIHFPSLDQLFSEFENQQDENINQAEDLVRESEDLKKSLEQISREMKREKEIDWDRKRSIESNLEKQKKIQEKIEQVEKKLNDAIQKMEKNQLFSPEILEKYRQLQNLFQEIITPELLRAMQEVQKSVDELNQADAQKSLEKFKINQEQFKQNLERTLALFNKIKLEQELDRLVKMSQVMKKEQDKISDQLEEGDRFNAAKQKDLMEKTTSQQEKLQDVQQSLDLLLQNPDMRQYPASTEQMVEALQQAEQIQKELQTSSEQLSQSARDQARQTSQQSAAKMAALNEKLRNAQTQMQNAARENIRSKMEKITSNLLKLSKQEESLVDETDNLSDFSDRYPEVAGNQQNILENMNNVAKDLIDLSHETFLLPPGISQSMGAAHSDMMKSMSELENRQRGTASALQKKSMSGLNASVMQMQQAMKGLGEEGSGMGFEQFLEKMQQLSQGQGQLNEQGLNFFNQNNGRLSLEQQGQLRRMAAEQQAIQKSLEQLEDQMKDKSDLLGDLGHMAKEMEEVVKDLQAMKLDRKTIERQQTILSRMLDAQKSVREKEYSKKRLAEVGQDYKQKSPGQPRNYEDLKLKQLNLDLLRALQEGYGPDYEKIIETYFKALNADISK